MIRLESYPQIEAFLEESILSVELVPELEITPTLLTLLNDLTVKVELKDLLHKIFSLMQNVYFEGSIFAGFTFSYIKENHAEIYNNILLIVNNESILNNIIDNTKKPDSTFRLALNELKELLDQNDLVIYMFTCIKYYKEMSFFVYTMSHFMTYEITETDKDKLGEYLSRELINIVTILTAIDNQILNRNKIKKVIL